MPRRDRRPDLTGRVVVVTGGNSGIGKETVAGLANLGATVVLASRDPGRGEAAKADLLARSRPTGAGDIVVGELDLGSFASIRSFAAWVLDRFDRLDVLVCNAGLITEQRRTTAEGFEEMFGVNHLGHFLLADLVRERLVASAPSRVVVVSSFAHRWVVGGLPREDLQREQGFGSFAAYGGSKLANLQFARELARRLGPSGVVVNALHPGSIKSHFGGDGDTGMLGWLMGTLGPFVLRGPRNNQGTLEPFAREAEEATQAAFQELPAGLRIGDVTALSFDAMQGLISRYRMAGLPPDLLVTVPVSAARTLDFHRATELIELGRELTAQALDDAGY